MSRAGSKAESTPRRGAVEEDDEIMVVDDVEAEEAATEDEDLEEDEYEVEAVVGHKLEKGKYKYLVAWKGYGPEHNTWEPQENVDHAKDIVSAYWSKQPKDAALGSIRKRKSEPAEPPRRRRPSKAASRAESVEHEAFADTHVDAIDKYADVADWDDLVKTVDTIERTGEDRLIVYLTMKAGERVAQSAKVCNKRCPQAMLRFYESHLKWRSPGE